MTDALSPLDIEAELKRRGLADAQVTMPQQPVIPSQLPPNPTAQQAAPDASPLPQNDIMNEMLRRGIDPNLAPQQPAPAVQTPVTQAQPNGSSFSPNGFGRFHAPQQSGGDLPFLDRFQQGLRDPIDAGAQLLTRVLPTGAVNAVNSATQFVNDLPVIGPVTKSLGMVPATNQQINDAVTQENQDYANRRKAAGGSGFDVPRLIGNITAQAPLAYLVPPGATIPRAIASGAAAGAAGGALTPVTGADQNNFWQEKAQQAGLGAVTGGVTGGLLKGLEKTISPTVNPDVQLLMSKGVTPTPGQVMGGAAAKTEEKLTSIPILGDMIQGAQKRAIHQFNTAAYNEALAPIGQKITPAEIGRDGVQAVENKISDAYDALLPKLTFQVDGQLGQEVNQLAAQAQSLPPAQANQFMSILKNNVGSQLSQGGTMTGETFKTVDSSLGLLKRRLAADPDAFNKSLGDAVSSLQTSMRDALRRANPQYGPDLSKIDLAHANFLRVADAAGRIGNEGGVFTPAQLQAAVRSLDSSGGKRQFATGNALMQDLSEAGKNVLGSKYPDSGTAGRLLANVLAGGGLYALNPKAAIGVGTAALAYTPLGQKLVAGLLAGQRPAAAGAIASGLGKAAPAIGQTVIRGLLGSATGG